MTHITQVLINKRQSEADLVADLFKKMNDRKRPDAQHEKDIVNFESARQWFWKRHGEVWATCTSKHEISR